MCCASYYRMAVMVEGYVRGRKVTYDLVKFNQLLIDALVGKGVLSKEDVAGFYEKSR